MNLNHEKLTALPIPMGAGWLLAACMEARGKQDLWIRQRSAVLAELRERATIESVESSNRIEGVTVEADRLRPLVIGRAKPRDRSEQELAGYRTALSWVFSRRRPGHITPMMIRQMHTLAQSGARDAGQWKSRNNDIVEIALNGERRVRSTPVPASLTPAAMDELARRYELAVEDTRLPPLLLIATFIFDFLCIHPFRDGNGRVSRLTTTLLLQLHGFEVGRYVSLERLIEENKDEYYRVLELCSQGWHEGKNDIVPWWNYFLGTVRRAYQEFERQMGTAAKRTAKSELVRQAVLLQVEKFQMGEIAEQLPLVSQQLVRKVLLHMKGEGILKLEGFGRGAWWELAKNQKTE